VPRASSNNQPIFSVLGQSLSSKMVVNEAGAILVVINFLLIFNLNARNLLMIKM